MFGGGDAIACPLAVIPRRCVALRPLRDSPDSRLRRPSPSSLASPSSREGPSIPRAEWVFQEAGTSRHRSAARTKHTVYHGPISSPPTATRAQHGTRATNPARKRTTNVQNTGMRQCNSPLIPCVPATRASRPDARCGPIMPWSPMPTPAPPVLSGLSSSEPTWQGVG